MPAQVEMADAMVSCPAEGGVLSGDADALAQGVSPRSPIPRVHWTSLPLGSCSLWYLPQFQLVLLSQEMGSILRADILIATQFRQEALTP